MYNVKLYCIGVLGNEVIFLSPVVCSMGTSTNRLYSTLAPTISDNGIPQSQEFVVETDLEPVDPTDPNELLKECQKVLENRPPRLQRDFFYLKNSSQAGDCRPIKVLQWNILAQGLFCRKLFHNVSLQNGPRMH